MPNEMQAALDRTHLRGIIVDHLGRDALVLRRYGLALLDRDALLGRSAAIAESILLMA